MNGKDEKKDWVVIIGMDETTAIERVCQDYERKEFASEVRSCLQHTTTNILIESIR